MDKAIPEQIIDRAVVVWKRALANPVYRNTLPHEREHGQMEAMNAMTALLPKNNTTDVLDRFGAELKDLLTNGYMYTPTYGDKVPTLRKTRSIHVDYHPDEVLKIAADRAGLKMEFPIKTSMYINQDSLSFSMGYGAPNDYHYPMPNGRWLVTTLSGEKNDCAALVAYADAKGDLPFARIDK